MHGEFAASTLPAMNSAPIAFISLRIPNERAIQERAQFMDTQIGPYGTSSHSQNNAQVIREFLSSGDIVIAHNASFDFGFIEREYAILRQKPIKFRQFCTMAAYRQTGLPGRASLASICGQIGLARTGKTHGALEDSWLALMVYFWLQHAPPRFIQPFSGLLNKGVPLVPTNFQEPPLSVEDVHADKRSSDRLTVGTTGIKEALFKAVRPTAVLLLEIARSDESIAAAEIEIIATVIRNTCNRLGIPVNEQLIRQILDELYQINITQNLLTRSARSICSDLIARAEFPKLVAAMAAADGGFSAIKRGAVDRVKAAIQRVLPTASDEPPTHPPSARQ